MAAHQNLAQKVQDFEGFRTSSIQFQWVIGTLVAAAATAGLGVLALNYATEGVGAERLVALPLAGATATALVATYLAAKRIVYTSYNGYFK